MLYPRPRVLRGHGLPIGTLFPTAAPSVIISLGSHVLSVSRQRPKESQHILNSSFPLMLLPPAPKETNLWAENLFLPPGLRPCMWQFPLPGRFSAGSAGLACGDGVGLGVSSCYYPSPNATLVEDKQH